MLLLLPHLHLPLLPGHTLLIRFRLPGRFRRLLHPYMERSAEGTLTHADICRMEEIVAALGGMEGAWNQIHTYQKRAEEILEALPSSDISLQLGKIVRKLGAV